MNVERVSQINFCCFEIIFYLKKFVVEIGMNVERVSQINFCCFEIIFYLNKFVVEIGMNVERLSSTCVNSMLF
jgi:hypothetical protein